jgi:hypothetical protein
VDRAKRLDRGNAILFGKWRDWLRLCSGIAAAPDRSVLVLFSMRRIIWN